MRGRAWIVALAAVVVGGCGGEPTLGSGDAAELRAQVAAVREAAGQGDRDAALKALDGLQARVRELQDGGSLAGADATALRRGIGQARRRVRAELAEPTPAATATPAPTPAATPTATAEPPPEGDGEEQPVPGNGKAKGKKKPKAKGKPD